jgi:hypothetical protein
MVARTSSQVATRIAALDVLAFIDDVGALAALHDAALNADPDVAEVARQHIEHWRFPTDETS